MEKCHPQEKNRSVWILSWYGTDWGVIIQTLVLELNILSNVFYKLIYLNQ